MIEGAEMGDLNAKVNAAIRADYKGETVDSTAAAQKSIDRQARHPPPLPSAFSLSLPLYLEPMIQEEPENSRLALGKVASWKVF